MMDKGWRADMSFSKLTALDCREQAHPLQISHRDCPVVGIFTTKSKELKK